MGELLQGGRDPDASRRGEGPCRFFFPQRPARTISRSGSLRRRPQGRLRLDDRTARGGQWRALCAADAVVRIESRYNPRASNGGALGLMQIKPATARGLGFSGPASALYEPETNIRFGVRYLAQAYRMSGGDVCGTVMRYQSGHFARGMNAANRAYCSKARLIMASL